MFCQQIELDLVRLENAYAEKMELLRANASTATTEEFHSLQAMARNAKHDLDFARAELDTHIWTRHRKANAAITR